MSTRRRIRTAAPTAAEQHRAWLELVDTDGPFLSVPALKKGWPAGMPAPRDSALAALRDARGSFENAWEKWDREPANPSAISAYRAARDAWVDTVLRDVVGWGTGWTVPLASGPEVRSPDHAVTVRPSGGFVHADAAAVLVLVVDPCTSLRNPIDDGWAVSPLDRMEELLRAAGVPIGVVTDGRWWAIVDAQPEVLVASGIVDALTWTEEPAARNAFVELLGRRGLVGGDAELRLPKLFAASVAEAEEITEALGVQVRRAVELLVAALSESGVDAQRHDRPDPLPPDRAGVYEAAVTMTMQVVFLLFAQERGLLPQSSLFTRGYGIAGELDELERRFSDEQAEGLDSTALTWHRLLATARAVYHGASFEDLRLPSYGGSLFDPARFGWLTARTEQGVLAVSVSDRVMLEVLRAVQVARLKGEPARRISFRDIDVEQIGYIYEGLLGYSCARVETVTVGLIGREGAEPKIALDELEELADGHADPGSLADAILAAVKVSQPASVPKSRAAMIKALRGAAEIEDAERALRAVTASPGLRDRLRPFLGVIRRDLRNRPTVFEPGGVFVVETPSRATAGAHYTPRKLAEEVVRYALEPLVYEPGPHQEPDPEKWELVRPERILDLKVADIACGSGAFLVAAARYLAGKLVEAWYRDGTDAGPPDELLLRATRQVVAQCLYGADINAMAVEMAKLSLWLVSLDPKLPFSFVDDKILLGNSLLGLTDRRQIEDMHIDPARAEGRMTFFTPHVERTLSEAIRLRETLASEINNDDPQRSATAKRRQWERYQELVEEATAIADGVVAAGLRLGGKPGKNLDEGYENFAAAVQRAFAPDGPRDRSALDTILDAGLTPAVATDYARWKPLHWILQVPDVIEDHGGFDAVVGNPPFLGGKKVSGAQGTNVREWLVNVIADGAKGNADLIASFLLRGWALLNRRGTIGLIATNTLAQGDTRKVGLDQLDTRGFTITRAIQSRSWPVASANLEYAAVWGTRGDVGASIELYVDELPVASISTLLEPAGDTHGQPVRLLENLRTAFQGCIVVGQGFVLNRVEASELLTLDKRNSEVVSPYLNGEDVNHRPDSSPSRWIIDFFDRDQDAAAVFSAPFERILLRVKPERQKVNRRAHRERWWQYGDKRPAMRAALSGRKEALVIAQVSSTLMPVFVPTGQVYDAKLIVFSLAGRSDLAVLSSSVHRIWAIKYGTTMRTDATYTPTTCFENFPRPHTADRLTEIGRTLDEERREIMLRRELGLTKLYNLVNDPDVTDADRDVTRLREIHVELDEAVMAAYKWDDVPLDHGFHTYRQMRRWTVSPTARVEILDRLLEENHRRAAAQGEAPPPPPDEPDVEEEP